MDPLWNPLKNPYRSPPKPYSILIIKAQILGPADLNKYPKHSDPECLKPRPPETLTAITRNKRHIGALILRIGFWSPLDYIHSKEAPQQYWQKFGPLYYAIECLVFIK